MRTKYMAAAAIAALLFLSPGRAQSTADLLQKGIHAQETLGDVDGAIQIFRQVAASASNKLLAAQAQYQLVVCMLQKGDRSAAAQELQLLARNFPEDADLISKARKLAPGGTETLPEPWGESEVEQLNVKRDGQSTGEYLVYSVDHNHPDPRPNWNPANYFPQALVLRWELNTKTTNRSLLIEADRDTMQPVGKRHEMKSNDDLDDPTAIPFKGPAIDNEESVFPMRRLPLAVGYKTKLPVTVEQVVPSQLELAVTGIEPVQTPAGKFNCYKISFAAIGQTFWIGAEASRPLVKFQSGTVEAELVKVWGPENLTDSALAFLPAAGWKVDVSTLMGPTTGPAPGPVRTGWFGPESSPGYGNVWMRKIYTASSEIAASLRQALDDYIRQRQRDADPGGNYDFQLRQGSLQSRLIGGKQALSCIVDYMQRQGDRNDKKSEYLVWIRTESTFIKFSIDTERDYVGVRRWQFDPVVATAKIP
jgi:hypothetical protein